MLALLYVLMILMTYVLMFALLFVLMILMAYVLMFALLHLYLPSTRTYTSLALPSAHAACAQQELTTSCAVTHVLLNNEY